jgi:DNA-binding Xre family transcriptional regulator
MFFIDCSKLICHTTYKSTFLKDSAKKRGAKKMISYKKLWKLLIDKDLKKKDLITVAGVSSYTVNKLTHGDNVTTDVLQRICKALGCDIGDIMEIIDNEPKQEQPDRS